MNHIRLRASIGTFILSWNDQGLLTSIDWLDQLTEGEGELVGSWSALSRNGIPKAVGSVLERLQRYFDCGEPLGDVPWECLDQIGWTEFQAQVYRAVSEIPHGETRNYAWVARRIGKFAASRAVGQALRRNPFPILIPCHRVTSISAIGGFMGISGEAQAQNNHEQAEIRLKRQLIELEESYLNPVFSFLMPGARPEAQDGKRRESAKAAELDLKHPAFPLPKIELYFSGAEITTTVTPASLAVIN